MSLVDVTKGPFEQLGGAIVAKDAYVGGVTTAKYKEDECMVFRDDFFGNALNPTWTLYISGGGVAGALVNASPSSYALTSGATGGQLVRITRSVPPVDPATKYTVLEFRTKLNNVTAAQCSVRMGLFNNFNDCCYLRFDTNSNNWMLYYSKEGTAPVTIDTGISPIINTFRYWKMEWIDGVLRLYTKLTSAASWESVDVVVVAKAVQTALTHPIYFNNTSTGTSVVLTIDYVKLYTSRD